MAVTVGGYTIQDVYPGNDTSSDLAFRLAETIVRYNAHNGMDYAIIDRNDGLVIFRGQPGDKSFAPHNKRGWHFASAICGYSGNGPISAAMILERFGFGTYEDLMDVLKWGGDEAHYHFRKGEGVVKSGR